MSQDRRPLSELEQSTDFTRRHIGPSPADVTRMLETLGMKTLDELIEKVIPAAILSPPPDEEGRTEAQVLADARALADRNTIFTSMIGMGYYDCHTPSVILRNVFENPGWYTAYTPYQAEIAQGRLEALLTFQQMVIDLTGMEIANASLLDEATAAAEAMTLMKRVGKSKSETLFVAADCHPQTLAVIETRARALGIVVVTGDPATDLVPEQVFGAILQYPTTTGEVQKSESDPRASPRPAP